MDEQEYEICRQCSWCGRIIEFRPTILISHGSCRDCFEKLMQEIKEQNEKNRKRNS